MQRKPDLIWLNTPATSIRGGIIFENKSETPAGKNEFRFSVTKEGMINFSESLWDWENGFGLDRTIAVIVKILTYTKMIYNKFGYFGKAQATLRAYWVQEKTLTNGGVPLKFPPFNEFKTVAKESAESISFWIEDIREDNLEPCLSLVSNFIRDLFNFAVDEPLVRSLIKKGYRS